MLKKKKKFPEGSVETPLKGLVSELAQFDFCPCSIGQSKSEHHFQCGGTGKDTPPWRLEERK